MMPRIRFVPRGSVFSALSTQSAWCPTRAMPHASARSTIPSKVHVSSANRHGKIQPKWVLNKCWAACSASSSWRCSLTCAVYVAHPMLSVLTWQVCIHKLRHCALCWRGYMYQSYLASIPTYCHWLSVDIVDTNCRMHYTRWSTMSSHFSRRIRTNFTRTSWTCSSQPAM